MNTRHIAAVTVLLAAAVVPVTNADTISAVGVTITQLNSPDEFSAPTTTIDFDDFPNNTCANTVYAEQGIESFET